MFDPSPEHIITEILCSTKKKNILAELYYMANKL